MNRKIILFILILLFIPFISAQTVDEEISGLIDYAEQYEMGNINYLELLIQASLVRENVNEILGSFNANEYSPSGITAEAAEQYFGIPKDYTNHAWSSSTNDEVKLDEEIPWFEKIIFDGKRVQMSFNAWPHVYDKNGEQTIYYWTDFKIKYKKELDMDIDSTIANIKSSGDFYLQGSGSALETATLIVTAERELRQYTEQNKENCESVMNNIFSGNIQSNEKMEHWNVNLYEGENLDVTMIVNMPECSKSCQSPSINIWLNPKSDEPIDFSSGGDSGEYTKDSFPDYTIEQLEEELANTIKEMRGQIKKIDNERVEWSSLSRYESEINALNEALSESYYNKDDNSDDKDAFEQRRSKLKDIILELGSIEVETVQERRYEQRLVTNTVEHQDAWCQNTNEISCNTQEEACIAGACTYALGGLEDCENEIDDDGDTVVDCRDPDCARSCGTFCQSTCGGDCGECRNDCYETSCKECWSCDREDNTDEYCNELCESSGCNSCDENCRQQSFCANCNICQESIKNTGINNCAEECSPCTKCYAQYETLEEAKTSCAETCDPCTTCKTPSLNDACYQVCDEISFGIENTVCYGLCDERVLFICNGQQQYSPCIDTTYICEGTMQPFPCTIYSCKIGTDVQKQTVPCGEEFCGENQVLDGTICTCMEGYYDCDNDGACTDTSSCGQEYEICNDGFDNDGDQLVDCQDLSVCEAQVCSENSLCHEGSCLTIEEISVCADGEVLQNGICRKLCSLQEECSQTEFCSYGYCNNKISCTTNEDCITNQECQEGFCEDLVLEGDPIETGQACNLESDCSGERDICSSGLCKEIPLENYNNLVEEGLIAPALEPELISEEVTTKIIEEIEEQPLKGSITGFILWVTHIVTGRAVSETCKIDEDCSNNQGCDRFRGECYCKDLFFDCNEDISDGCESSDPTCGGTQELCPGGCGENQYCNEQRGNCDCTKGYYNCDGTWWDCESVTECTSCTSNEDCAQPTCSPYNNVAVINFACMKGSSWQEDKGVLSFSGGCTTYPSGKVDSWINFNSWGEPFNEINNYKWEIESSLGNEWCKREKENALRQRLEIEKSLMDQAFIENLFAQLLTEDTQEWKTRTSAIYSMYWSIVENTRQLARSSQCLGEEFPTLTPLELSYESEAGSIDIWEEITYAEEFERDVLTPYMKLGIFPPKELVKEEFRKAAVEGHFPGPEGEQNGPSAKELEEIRADPEGMQYIKDLTADYEDGSLDTKITITDKDESIFIIDFSISEKNLFQVKPVASYEKKADITVEIDFDFIYNLISEEEKDARIEHPEWVEDSFQEDFDEVVQGGFIITKITNGFITGDISVSPISKVGTTMKLLGHMFGEGH